MAEILPTMSEDKVRTKLQADGCAVVQLTSDARYIEAAAAKSGRVGHLMIDTLTDK